MLEAFEKYRNYDVTEFAMDDSFIEWIYAPSEENVGFWNDFLQKFPGQAHATEEARNILLSIHAPSDEIDENIKDQIWQNILANDPNGKVRKMPKRRFWISAAASVLLILGGVAYFLLINNDSHPGIVKNKSLNSDALPGGNKAILTLADGSTIILDSAQKGTLAQQGNVQVIKLSGGQLTYHQDGSSKKSPEYNTISTPRGGQYKLILADGSKIWLNAASSITYPTVFSGDKREVTITGEAYFEVAHNVDMPFHVLVNKLDVAVLGTHFNINAYSDEGDTKTTLLEGSVKVSSGKESVKIKPGEQANVADNSNRIILKRNVNLEETMAWKNGLFYFDNAGIREIMKKISRWYDVDIEIGDNVPDTKFNGKIYRDVNASEVFKILEEGGIKIKIVGKKAIVSI